MNDASQQTKILRSRMLELVGQLRADVPTVAEPQARAMFETSAEVLAGLVKAFDDYGKKTGSPWSEHPGFGYEKPRPQSAAFLKHFGH